MPNQQVDYQEPQQWIVVTKNKNKHKGSIKNKQIHNRGNQNIFTPDYQHQYIQKFISSKAFEFNKKLIEEKLNKIQATSNIHQFHIECLGLGNFLSNKKSFIQLQFMQQIILPIVRQLIVKQQNTCMNQKLQRPQITQNDLSINMYDPAFSKPELKHINQLCYESVQKYKIKKGRINIFFMPHCERNLYEQVYQQYKQIGQQSITPLFVIGNSIEQYKQRCTLIKQKIPDIFLQTKFTQQRIFDYENALNDTFILI